MHNFQVKITSSKHDERRTIPCGLEYARQLKTQKEEQLERQGYLFQSDTGKWQNDHSWFKLTLVRLAE